MFRHLREELGVEVACAPKNCPMSPPKRSSSPYSGHATRQSLEIYSRLALADAQQRYDDVIGDFPV